MMPREMSQRTLRLDAFRFEIAPLERDPLVQAHARRDNLNDRSDALGHSGLHEHRFVVARRRRLLRS